MEVMRRQRWLMAWAVSGLLLIPAVAVAETCHNDCQVKATEWMNENNKTYEEGKAYYQGCYDECIALSSDPG